MHFQDAFTILCVDRTARDLFSVDPTACLSPWGLSKADQHTLENVPPIALNRYATSLLNKRAAEFSRAVTLSLRIVPNLPHRYKIWLATSPATVVISILPPGLREALRFLPHLHNALKAEPLFVPWAGDFFAFEILGKCSWEDGAPRYLHTDYPLKEIAQEIQRGLIPTEVTQSPQTLHFRGRTLVTTKRAS